jgi:uncharacterized protein (TIGR02246 family)
MTTTKTKLAATTALLSATLLAGAPLRGGMVGMEGPEAGITKVAEAYAAAMLAGDAAAAAAVYAEDAIEMPPGHPAVRGRAAIEAYYRGMFSGCRFTEFTLQTEQTRVSGDVGYAVGLSRVSLTPAGGPPVHEAGKYLVVLKRSGGSWKVAYAIHNADETQGPLSATR